MKLISMTDFVLEQEKSLDNILAERMPILKLASSYDKITKYANFLKQPLTIGMFVPTDEKGNVLEEPKRDNFLTHGICRTDDFTKALKEYEKAKERVLFKDSVVYDYSPFIQTKRILINLKCDQTFRVYTELQYASGGIDRKTFPNWYFSRPPLIEDVLGYDLELSDSAIKQIGL